MTSNLNFFKEILNKDFEFTKQNDLFYSKDLCKYFDLRKVELKNTPNSILFEKCELFGLYEKGTTNSYAFYFLTYVYEDYFSFKFYIEGNEIKATSIKSTFHTRSFNKVLDEVSVQKEYIIEQIINSPFERLVNLFKRKNRKR